PMKKHPKSLYGPEGPDRKWIKSFADWYNDEHLHSAISFFTPNARHGGIDRKTLANRAILYATARALNPQRWAGKTRNWQPAGPVWLNPENEICVPEIRDAA
ncbi:MAG: putative transposase, partial [Paracoccaceae bacterium]